MALKFSKFVDAVIERASEEARDRNHNYLSSEHIFLALLNTDKSIGQKLLHDFSIATEIVIDQIDRISHRGNSIIPRDCSFPKTPRRRMLLL